MAHDLLRHLWIIALDAAPWLLLGLVAAGLIKAWIPSATILRWLGGKGLGSIVRAALLGTPLPLCSCGVLPVAMGLRKQGASRGATVSFLIATPENGVDSITLSYALLGPFMMVARPIAAIFSAILAGILTDALPDRPAPLAAKAGADSCGGSTCGCGHPEPQSQTPPASPAKSGAESCCDASCECGHVAPLPLSASPSPGTRDDGACCGTSCGCSQARTDAPARLTAAGRTIGGLRYALTEILDDVAVWLALGVVAAAMVATFAPPDVLSRWGTGWPAMLVMLLAGLPMYICATASTPVAAALLAAGVSPGAALVFLLAGPATNIGAMAVIRRDMGTPTLLTYLLGISLGAVASGLAVDAIVGHLGLDIAGQLAATESEGPSWLAVASLMVLVFFAIRPLRRWLGRVARVPSPLRG